MINRKLIATTGLCVVALMAVTTTSYYMKKDESKVNLSEVNNTETTENAMFADLSGDTEKITNIFGDNLEDFAEVDGDVQEDETPGDRISDVEEEGSSFLGNEVDVASHTTEEESTSFVTENPIRSEDANGLSAAANAVIDGLNFGEGSDMMWPVQGNILLEYNMENTVYFSTLNEYKTNPALIIQGTEYSPVISAAKGVVTELSDNEEIGVYIKMSVGNGYEVTYGQLINPLVSEGDTVEAGATIASVNTPTRYYEKEGYNLYFQVTKDGEYVDPMDFLVLSE